MWCVADLDSRYIEKMEEVLALMKSPMIPPSRSSAGTRNVSAVSEARRWNSLELRGNADGALSIQPFERSRGAKLWGFNRV